MTTRSAAAARPSRKGEQTRKAILAHALGLATRIGFEGLTIGRLADDLDMSKSGLFAHFRSKEALQLEILRMAGARLVDTVVKPALATPRGEPRVRALFERWLAWEQSPSLPGGCPFMAASFELDDRPGPPALRTPLLVIHDRGDAEVPWQHGRVIAHAWRGAALLMTDGLGHRRILRDPDVVAAAVAFLAARTEERRLAPLAALEATADPLAELREVI